MKKPERKIIHEGRAWYTVPAAARMLSTTAPKVRELMGAGELEWAQAPRRNGPIIVSADSIVGRKKQAG